MSAVGSVDSSHSQTFWCNASVMKINYVKLIGYDLMETLIIQPETLLGLGLAAFVLSPLKTL